MKILTYISTIKPVHTCLSLYSKAEEPSLLTVYFSLGLQNIISVLFSLLDCSFTGLTNFWVTSCFQISYSSSFTACQKSVLLSTPISIPSNKAKKRARNKSTFIATEYLQNVIKLKQNFLNNLFNTSPTFFIFLLGIVKFISACFQSFWKQTPMMYDIFLERHTAIQYLFCPGTWQSQTKTNSFFHLYEESLFSSPKIFVIKSIDKTKRFIWNIFYSASPCIYVRINVAIPNVIDSDPRRSISF